MPELEQERIEPNADAVLDEEEVDKKRTLTAQAFYLKLSEKRIEKLKAGELEPYEVVVGSARLNKEIRADPPAPAELGRMLTQDFETLTRYIRNTYGETL